MSIRQTVSIPVHPWFKDHHFNGQTIFPAVESMLLLAEVAKEIRPDIQRTVISEALFSKFLSIPEDVKDISALVEINDNEEGIGLKLLSKIQFKKMSRIKEHAELFFYAAPQKIETVSMISAKDNSVTIDSDRIYKELVPFGPTYRTLKGPLHLFGKSAWGTLEAPILAKRHTMENEIGSVFPLDGAMHAACVLGQCLTDFVPFPVGFASRQIHKPTQAGESYNTTVLAQSITEDELLFDLSIYDMEGTTCETVLGLRMRDVSRGAIKPHHDLPRLTASPQ